MLIIQIKFRRLFEKKLVQPIKPISRPCFISAFIGVFLWPMFAVNLFAAIGDRGLPMVLRYPAGAFTGSGGRLIDITKAPYNAKGDGVTDDTKALIAAYDFVVSKLKDGSVQWDVGAGYTIYLPKGIYLVSNTIIHSGSRIQYDMSDVSIRGESKIRFIGEDRNKTIIRLQDNCPGFEVGKQKQVLAYQKDYEGELGNNIPAMNLLRNLTVNTGSGNPGAVGVMFLGANVAGISNVTIKSGDGQGAIGLDFPVYSVQGHYKDITIEGFNVGIQIEPYAETNPALEYITLRGQKKAGLLVGRGSPSIRKLLSQNLVPAIIVEGKGAQVILVDSYLDGGAASVSAVVQQDASSHLFMRNVEIGAAYGGSVRLGYDDVHKGYVSEWQSSKAVSLWTPKDQRSLNMPIEESPPYSIPTDPNDWANPESFTGNDTERLQKAMNSGKPAVFLPKDRYSFSTVTVPATVKYVDMMFGTLQGTIRVTEASESPVWFEHTNGNANIESGSDRTIATANTRRFAYHNKQNKPVKIFLEAGSDLGEGDDFCNVGVSIFGRSINNENKNESNFIVNGGRLWSLGYKTEGNQPSFEVKSGGVLEILGGYRNETSSDAGKPMVINDGGNVSFIGYSSMSSIYENGVWETRAGLTKKLMRTDLPTRDGYEKDFYIPLYLGYTTLEFPYLAAKSMAIRRPHKNKCLKLPVSGFRVDGLGLLINANTRTLRVTLPIE